MRSSGPAYRSGLWPRSWGSHHERDQHPPPSAEGGSAATTPWSRLFSMCRSIPFALL